MCLTTPHVACVQSLAGLRFQLEADSRLALRPVPCATYSLISPPGPYVSLCGAQTVLPFAKQGEDARGMCLRVEVKLANGHDIRLDLVSVPAARSTARHQPLLVTVLVGYSSVNVGPARCRQG